MELLNHNILPVDFSVFGELDKILLMENVKLLMDAEGKISEEEKHIEIEFRRNLS